ncbi:MAG: DUF808 family protein, partial [Burkholderiaceae bacterium]
MHSADDDAAEHAKRVSALADPKVDPVALEKDKVKGAVRTDLILSAEIIAITLGTVAQSDFLTQLGVLLAISVVMTIGVYGFVAGIVKLDDGGLYLSRRSGRGGWAGFQRGAGRAILAAAPWLMKGLSVAGTAAMFLVGGGILVHGIPALAHGLEALAASVAGGAVEWLLNSLGQALVGVLAGALVLGAVSAFQRWRKRPLQAAMR